MRLSLSFELDAFVFYESSSNALIGKTGLYLILISTKS